MAHRLKNPVIMHLHSNTYHWPGTSFNAIVDGVLLLSSAVYSEKMHSDCIQGIYSNNKSPVYFLNHCVAHRLENPVTMHLHSFTYHWPGTVFNGIVDGVFLFSSAV